MFAAMSVNGFIARDNHSEDFLSQGTWAIFFDLLKTQQALICGRKTYEIFSNQEVVKNMKGVTFVVVTSQPSLALADSWLGAASPRAALDLLAKRGIERAQLAGGSLLYSEFARAGLVDEIVLAVEPVFIGKGIPLLAPAEFDRPLDLVGVDTNQAPPVIRLHYRVASQSRNRI
jgi:dihydrofolate reductase